MSIRSALLEMLTRQLGGGAARAETQAAEAPTLRQALQERFPDFGEAPRPAAAPQASSGTNQSSEWTDLGYRGMRTPLEGESFTAAPGGLHGPGVYITTNRDIAGVHGEHVYPVQVRGRIATDSPSAARERGDAGYRHGHDVVIFDPANVRRQSPDASHARPVQQSDGSDASKKLALLLAGGGMGGVTLQQALRERMGA